MTERRVSAWVKLAVNAILTFACAFLTSTRAFLTTAQHSLAVFSKGSTWVLHVEDINPSISGYMCLQFRI